MIMSFWASLFAGREPCRPSAVAVQLIYMHGLSGELCNTEVRENKSIKATTRDISLAYGIIISHLEEVANLANN